MLDTHATRLSPGAIDSSGPLLAGFLVPMFYIQSNAQEPP